MPPTNQESQGGKKLADEQSAKAAESLEKGHTQEAANHMEQAKQGLERLADHLPALNQRKEQACDVAQLRQKQDEIAKQTQQAAEDAQNADPKIPRRKRRRITS